MVVNTAIYNDIRLPLKNGVTELLHRTVLRRSAVHCVVSLVAQRGRASDLRSRNHEFDPRLGRDSAHDDSGQVVHTLMPFPQTVTHGV